MPRSCMVKLRESRECRRLLLAADVCRGRWLKDSTSVVWEHCSHSFAQHGHVEQHLIFMAKTPTLSHMWRAIYWALDIHCIKHYCTKMNSNITSRNAILQSIERNKYLIGYVLRINRKKNKSESIILLSNQVYKLPTRLAFDFIFYNLKIYYCK